MKVVIQRVSGGRVSTRGELLAEIGQGMVLLVGVGQRDTENEAFWLAEKCAKLRIFEDSQGKMNLSLQDIQGEALVVSQFTLYADTEKGRRPSFIKAADPQIAEPLVQRLAEAIERHGVPTKTGEFGADMLVEIENDGPVTIILEKSPLKS
jgi:D-tyrosyl-tRNA(Tyr) deacylase